MRLIDADLVIKALEKEKARDDCRGGWYSTVCSIIRLLEHAPTVEVQECKSGEWVRVSADKYVQHAYHFYRCSECGEDFIGEHNFCPNCGADMRRTK